MMTRKDYESIAEIIFTTTGIVEQNDKLIDELGEYFKSDNPNFNMNQFKSACVRGK